MSQLIRNKGSALEIKSIVPFRPEERKARLSFHKECYCEKRIGQFGFSFCRYTHSKLNLAA